MPAQPRRAGWQPPAGRARPPSCLSACSSGLRDAGPACCPRGHRFPGASDTGLGVGLGDLRTWPASRTHHWGPQGPAHAQVMAVPSREEPGSRAVVLQPPGASVRGCLWVGTSPDSFSPSVPSGHQPSPQATKPTGGGWRAEGSHPPSPWRAEPGAGGPWEAGRLGMDLHGAPGVLGTPHPLSGLPQPRGGPSSVRIPAQSQPPSD